MVRMANTQKAKISVKDCEWLDLFDDIPHKYVKDLDDDDEYELDVFIETKIVRSYKSNHSQDDDVISTFTLTFEDWTFDDQQRETIKKVVFKVDKKYTYDSLVGKKIRTYIPIEEVSNSTHRVISKSVSTTYYFAIPNDWENKDIDIKKDELTYKGENQPKIKVREMNDMTAIWDKDEIQPFSFFHGINGNPTE